MFPKGLESAGKSLPGKQWGSGMRPLCWSQKRSCLEDKVDEPVLQSPVLQNKGKQGLREEIFTSTERQDEEPRLHNVLWEDHLCSNILNPETDPILTPKHTVTAVPVTPEHTVTSVLRQRTVISGAFHLLKPSGASDHYSEICYYKSKCGVAD